MAEVVSNVDEKKEKVKIGIYLIFGFAFFSALGGMVIKALEIANYDCHMFDCVIKAFLPPIIIIGFMIPYLIFILNAQYKLDHIIKIKTDKKRKKWLLTLNTIVGIGQAISLLTLIDFTIKANTNVHVLYVTPRNISFYYFTLANATLILILLITIWKPLWKQGFIERRKWLLIILILMILDVICWFVLQVTNILIYIQSYEVTQTIRVLTYSGFMGQILFGFFGIILTLFSLLIPIKKVAKLPQPNNYQK